MPPRTDFEHHAYMLQSINCGQIKGICHDITISYIMVVNNYNYTKMV